MNCGNRKIKYRKIPKISPGAYIFQRPFLRGLYSEGLTVCTEGNLRFKIDWASLWWEGNLLFSLCFTLYARANSKYKPPGGLIFGGVIYQRDLGVTILRGLY